MLCTLATLDDIPLLVELLALLFDQEAEFSFNADLQTQGLKGIIENPDAGFIVVARHNGRIVGMVNVLLTLSTALGGRVGILEDMVVEPSKRGEGIGAKLLQNAVDRARHAGCQRLTLLTDRTNRAAHRFYQHYGFQRSDMIAFRLLID